MKEAKSKYGICYNCSAGTIGNSGSGFQQCEDGSSWHCRYCGSEQVEVKDKAGNIIASQIQED
jgi:ribosomal protein L40E